MASPSLHRNTLLLSFLAIILSSLLLLPPSLAHGGADDGDSSSSADEPDLRSKSLILVKIYCLIIVFFATFFAGISPCFVKWNNGLLVLGTQFAGGVFLGTATMHFLSDSNETFQDKTTKEYPFAFMLACAGYLLTMLGDCVIQWIFVKESNYGSPSNPKARLGIDASKGMYYVRYNDLKLLALSYMC